MPKYLETSPVRCFTESGYQRLRSYIGLVEKGQPKVVESNFAHGVSTKKLLQEWDNILVSISEKWPSLYAFEKDLAKKVGPMSVMEPLAARTNDIESYYDDILLKSKQVHPSALKAVVSEFGALGGLRVRSFRNTAENMRLSTNSGAPFWQKRRFVKYSYQWPLYGYELNLGSDQSEEIMLATKTDTGMYGLPAVIGWRGQEGGPSSSDVKQRVVWMFPYQINVAELSVYQPFIEGAQKHKIVPAWVSMYEVDRAITSLFDTKRSNDPIVCTDFTKFDQHFNYTLQNVAVVTLTNLLHCDWMSVDWLNNIFPYKYYIPLVVGADKNGSILMYTGEHGMASGSGGTNVDETIAHRALQYEAAIRANSRLNPYSQCLGDDGILSYPGITVDQVIETYESHGQECNKDKQYVSTDECIYLRRWHHKDYRIDGICAGVYSTLRALGRIRYPERFMNSNIWNEKMETLRAISIIQNCEFHPLREQFVDYCIERDRYKLGIDIPGFLDNIKGIAKESVKLMPDLLGYTKTRLQGQTVDGIESWWIVRYLKSKI
nr:MAG: RNA-dependent RNA-polymerase [Picobirnavirus sp.]